MYNINIYCTLYIYIYIYITPNDYITFTWHYTMLWQVVNYNCWYCVSCDFQIEFLQTCQKRNNNKIDGAERATSEEEQHIAKNESTVICHSTASNFRRQKNTSVSFLKVRVIHNSQTIISHRIHFMFYINATALLCALLVFLCNGDMLNICVGV